jgi:hypothetical protein
MGRERVGILPKSARWTRLVHQMGEKAEGDGETTVKAGFRRDGNGRGGSLGVFASLRAGLLA